MKINEAIERRFRNLEIERQIVAYAMSCNIGVLSTAQPIWFSSSVLQNIVVILKRSRTSLTFDSLLLEMKNKKVIKSLQDEELYKVAREQIEEQNVKQLSDKGVKVLLQQLYDMYESRRVLLGVIQVAKSVKSFNVLKAKKTLRDLSKYANIMDREKSGDWVEDFDQRVEVVEERATSSEESTNKNLIPTGIKRLDSVIGGLTKSEFGVIAGKPGVGKTAALVDFATYAYTQGYSVLFASGEMSKIDIQFRIDANLAGVPVHKFRTGDLDESAWKLWRNSIERYRNTQTNFLEVVAFPRNFKTESIEAEALRIQDKWEKEIDLICLDYLNIASPNGQTVGEDSKEWGNQASVVWDFKGLVAELNGGIAGWTAGQIKDEAFEVSKLELSHIKYARAISETAPIVIGLIQTPDDVLEKRIQFQVLKMRNAPPLDYPIYLHPNLELMRLHENVVDKKDLMYLETDVGEFRKTSKRKHLLSLQQQKRRE